MDSNCFFEKLYLQYFSNTAKLYLNDNFDGGETEFLYQNRREEAREGDVLIFPAGFTHTHRGNPPIGGTKYLITSWGLTQE